MTLTLPDTGYQTHLGTKLILPLRAVVPLL